VRNAANHGFLDTAEKAPYGHQKTHPKKKKTKLFNEVDNDLNAIHDMTAKSPKLLSYLYGTSPWLLVM